MGWRTIELAVSSFCNGDNLLAERLVRLDAVALLQSCEDFADEQKACAGLFFERLVDILGKECEVALVELAVLATRESKLDDASSVAALRHASNDRADVMRVAGQDLEIAVLEIVNALNGVAAARKLLAKTVSEESVHAEAVVAAGLEDILALDSAGIMLAAFVNAKGKGQLD